MADRIVGMRDGQVAQIGAPLELYDHPANVFVASFIGSPAMNLLAGVATVGAGGAAVQIDGALVPVPARVEVEPGRRMVLWAFAPRIWTFALP